MLSLSSFFKSTGSESSEDSINTGNSGSIPGHVRGGFWVKGVGG